MGCVGGSDLLKLPNECLQIVFSQLDPQDLGFVSQTCSVLASFVKDNKLLWRQVYLRTFDGPPADIPERETDWKEEVQSIVIAQKILASKDIDIKRESFRPVANTIVKLLKSARGNGDVPSRNVAALRVPFKSETNQNVFLCSSSLFAEAGNVQHQPADCEEDRQLSAHLHCLFGAPRWGWDTGDDTFTHPYARGRVYDIRRYTEHGTFWGPFMDDGSWDVDWERMEAIITVIGYNLKQLHDRSNGMFDFHWHDAHGWLGASPYSFQPLNRGFAPPVEDPYGVSGKWLRVVCFLDWYEFLAFNFAATPAPLEEDREPIDAEEATRLIIMSFVVEKIEPPGPDDCQTMPVVHFTGKSRAMRLGMYDSDVNANSDIIGTVRQTKYGEIRWTTFSLYDNHARWRSEGVQVGGIRSARGVIGNWFDKDYEPQGPVGPTAFWKTTDEVDVKDRLIDVERARATTIPLPSLDV